MRKSFHVKTSIILSFQISLSIIENAVKYIYQINQILSFIYLIYIFHTK
jgi:hypothetical protein